MPLPSSAAISRLFEAEKSADEMITRAREEAERAVADARELAEQILSRKKLGEGGHDEATQLRNETDEEKARIAREVELHIERIRGMAVIQQAQAVERLVQTLFGQS